MAETKSIQINYCLAEFNRARERIKSHPNDLYALLWIGDWYIELYLLGYPVEELLVRD